MPFLINDFPNPPVYLSNQDYKVVKYLDLTRFLSLLSKSSLFFCRVDKLEDKFEGTYTKRTIKSRIKQLEGFTGSPLPNYNITPEQTQQNIKDTLDFDAKQRALFCINCWNKESIESAALWKIYSDFNKGIMIESTKSKIIKAFENTIEEVQITEVQYISFNDDKMPWGNSNHPFLFKDRAYEFESEVRLLHNILPETGWEHDWANEEVEEGKYLNVNLHELIDRIVLSPYSPPWFFELIQDVSNKYGLNITPSKSRLAIQ